ncbi:MAG: TolC family protein [Marinifilaceae bacterium]
MKLKQLTALLLLLGYTQFTCVAEEILTLEKALEIAYKQSPSLIQTKMALEQQQLNLKAQKASLKSQFSLNVNPFNYTRNNIYDSYNSKWYANESKSASGSLSISQPIKLTDGTISLVNDVSWQDASNKTSGGTNTSYNHNISLRLEQPLFTYNRLKMQLRELELSLETAVLNYSIKQLNIEKNVTSEFYSLYQKQKDLMIAREEYNNQKQNYNIIVDKVNAGLIAREELYQAEVNLATSESSVYSQEISYENAKDNFKLLLGMALDTDLSVLPNTSITPIKVDAIAAVKHALDQRMELKQKEISLERDMFSLVRAKADNEFKGSISARIGLNALGDKHTNMYNNPTDNEQVGVSFQIPIIDWGAKKAKVKSTQIGIESNQIDFEEEKKSITLGVRQICRNLPTLISQIEIKKKSMENAERTYDINLEKYRNGSITGMELQQYQTQLTNAKQTYTNAIISYKLELLNLKIQTLWDFATNTSYLPVNFVSSNE